MCGIFASVGFPPDPTRIDVVAYRGPDGRGWMEFDSSLGPVAIGHRRLAILGLGASGAQPMQDPTGRLHLTFNGEIYNYIELRELLRSKGERFYTDTDAEVLLRAYQLWGEDALTQLRGMFAFVVWDDRAKRLFVARDRFGIKPLYFVCNSRGAAFASEIKQLIGISGEPPTMNLERVRDFLEYGLLDHTAETLFQNVKQLRPGECATIECHRDRLDVSIRRWYEIPTQVGELVLSPAEAAERFHELLSESVRLHLRSDVPLGTCLSGGLDSSSIVCLAADLLGRNGRRIQTITACYDDATVNEKDYADAVVRKTDAQPIYVYPQAEDIFDSASDITWHQDEPFGSTSIFAQACVFAAARRAGIKVMLDGQGADEQLAGYYSSFPYYLSGLLRQTHFVTAIQTVFERRRLHGAPIPAQLRAVLLHLLPEGPADWLREQYQSRIHSNWLNQDAFPTSKAASAIASGTGSLNLAPPEDVNTLCRAMTFSTNLQMLLHWEDRNSMAHSIEARVPFLDHKLVEFSLALPCEHKILRSETKRILRMAMKNILPAPVRDRRDKIGFATPEQKWFRDSRMKAAAMQGVDETIRMYPWMFDADRTKGMISDMLNGSKVVDFRLWRILNLGIWGKRFRISA